MGDINPHAHILPRCEHDEDQHIGIWHPLDVLEDQIVLQIGFSKNPHQAPCFKIDIEGVPHRFVHVKKQATWFVAAVGGTTLKKGDMPTVTVIEELTQKLFVGSLSKDLDDEPEIAVAAMGEVQDEEDAYDPMSQLIAFDDSPPLETPKKKKPNKTKKPKPAYELVRKVIMPKRPACVQCDAGLNYTVHCWMKPKSKSLHIRLEDLDWLCSYAADQHYFQGVARDLGVNPETAVAATNIEWNFNSKTFEVKVKSQSYDVPLSFMTAEMYDKLADAHDIAGSCEQGGKRYGSMVKRVASHKLLALWCEATMAGTQFEFENEWGYQFHTHRKKRKCDTHGEDAIVAVEEGLIEVKTAVAAEHAS